MMQLADDEIDRRRPGHLVVLIDPRKTGRAVAQVEIGQSDVLGNSIMPSEHDAQRLNRGGVHVEAKHGIGAAGPAPRDQALFLQIVIII